MNDWPIKQTFSLCVCERERERERERGGEREGGERESVRMRVRVRVCVRARVYVRVCVSLIQDLKGPQAIHLHFHCSSTRDDLSKINEKHQSAAYLLFVLYLYSSRSNL